MNIGRLNKLITIESNTTSKDANGFSTSSWSTHITAWATLQSMTGREYVGSDQVEGDTTHKFFIHYKTGITRGMRISWSGRTFDIQSAIPIEDERYLAIMVKESDS